MTRVATLFLGLATLIFGAGTVDDVRAAAAGWRDAAAKKDQAALNKYLADDLVYTHSGDLTQTKSEFINLAVKVNYGAYTFTDVVVQNYGKSATFNAIVVRGAQRVRVLEVYVNNEGQWQMSSHMAVQLK